MGGSNVQRSFTDSSLLLFLPGTQFSSTGEVEDDDLIGLFVLLAHTGKFRPGGDSFLVPGIFHGSHFWAFTGLLNGMLGVMAGISCRLDAILMPGIPRVTILIELIEMGGLSTVDGTIPWAGILDCIKREKVN